MTLAWSQIDEPPAWVHVDASDADTARDVMIADGRDRIAWRLDGALYVVRDAEPVAVAPWWSSQDAREVLRGLAAVAPRETLVVAACAPVRTVLHLVPAGEERPRVAIETAERWALAALHDAVAVAGTVAATSDRGLVGRLCTA